MSLKKGVIYFVNGSDKHFPECLYSLKTLRKYHPKLPVTLFSTTEVTELYEKQFNSIIRINDSASPFKLKVKAMMNSPYEKTLYLDADTAIKGALHEIWEFLEIFEMAIARESHCNWDWNDFKLFDFRGPDFNTGVIAYRKTEFVNEFLEQWLASMDVVEDKRLSQAYGDQNFFNDLLNQQYADRLSRILELPNKIYNVRPWVYDRLSEREREQLIKIHHAHNLHWGFIKKVQNRLQSFKQKK
jgi:lipopolysaccharide biosynthesis glycosyltransferase